MKVFLEKVAGLTRDRVERSKAAVSAASLRETCAGYPSAPSFRDAIKRRRGEGVTVIAEIKRSSPSRGPIRPDLSVEDLVTAYERGGARAISILTEPEFFTGDLGDINTARALTRLPILRKDFILDPYQILEARAAGASAVLLIAAMLEAGELRSLLAHAEEVGLDALVEIHDEEELHAALGSGADILGINNRDLKTLEVDLETTRRLAPMIPAARALVSESGYSGAGQLAELPSLGVDAVLIGEALVREGDPARALMKLRGE